MRKLRGRRVSTGTVSRRFFRYRTRGPWSRARRAAWLPGTRGIRFVVTSLSRKRVGAQVLYEKLYCMRGETEDRGAFADQTLIAIPCANASLLCDFRQR